MVKEGTSAPAEKEELGQGRIILMSSQQIWEINTLSFTHVNSVCVSVCVCLIAAGFYIWSACNLSNMIKLCNVIYVSYVIAGRKNGNNNKKKIKLSYIFFNSWHHIYEWFTFTSKTWFEESKVDLFYQARKGRGKN